VAKGFYSECRTLKFTNSNMINLVKNEQVEQMPHLRGHENKDAQHRYSFQKRKIKTSKLYHTPIKIDNIRSMTYQALTII
jgi:hypothetical protein